MIITIFDNFVFSSGKWKISSSKFVHPISGICWNSIFWEKSNLLSTVHAAGWCCITCFPTFPLKAWRACSKLSVSTKNLQNAWITKKLQGISCYKQYQNFLSLLLSLLSLLTPLPKLKCNILKNWNFKIENPGSGFPQNFVWSKP